MSSVAGAEGAASVRSISTSAERQIWRSGNRAMGDQVEGILEVFMFGVTICQKMIHGWLGLGEFRVRCVFLYFGNAEVMHRMELEESCDWKESRDNGGHI